MAKPVDSSDSEDREDGMSRLQIENFAHLRSVDIAFGDLTVLVGPQASGKSLTLQWLKAALDGRNIVKALTDAGHPADEPAHLVDLIFGVGMGSGWSADSSVRWENRAVDPGSLSRRGDKQGKARLLYIPAHRALLINDGWAQPFQKLGPDTPVVARLFSQWLFELFRPALDGGALFPRERVLKSEYRDRIDAAVFHGGEVSLREDEGRVRRLHLTHGDVQLPFMTWTSGQREFTPLLFGLYSALPPRKQTKDEHLEWVVIEEPEMGLHPEAITVVLLLCLELLSRGYRVVVSTHSPLVLSAVWMLRRLREIGAGPEFVCDAFDVPARGKTKDVANAALDRGRSLRTFLLKHGPDGVVSKDISSLDPGSEDDDVSGWGGLAGFGSHFGETVRRAVEASRR
ncbi:AAA family ATPase [Engelhardtia mirabilis]|uniref:ATPase AAA-type core domain-containing protein n=1 Tax=Engelhardtia mirabilis TaxID=2528011 RepID=A0A518BRN5_9BACT|nr:hypothetical protein Pla133_47620 [Planctomycetes bacterium Pla133]QDV03967.1 hypothetical protein Pla86_47600 [Planctomycetes bacterium Pla86]